MAGHLVYRLERATPLLVGMLGESGESFSYDPSYLSRSEAAPLSLSLPLREEGFDGIELRPYFEGLLAEGRARTVLAAELGIAEEDWAGMLADGSRWREPSQRRRSHGTTMRQGAGIGFAPSACPRVRISSRRATCAICRRSSFSACPPRSAAD